MHQDLESKGRTSDRQHTYREKNQVDKETEIHSAFSLFAPLKTIEVIGSEKTLTCFHSSIFSFDLPPVGLIYISL